MGGTFYHLNTTVKAIWVGVKATSPEYLLADEQCRAQPCGPGLTPFILPDASLGSLGDQGIYRDVVPSINQEFLCCCQ